MGEVRLPQTACWGYGSIENTRPRLLVCVPSGETLKGAASAASIDRVAWEK